MDKSALIDVVRECAGMIEAKRGLDFDDAFDGDGIVMVFNVQWRGFSAEQLRRIMSIACFNGLVVRNDKVALYFV
jgi:hypothetical protein